MATVQQPQQKKRMNLRGWVSSPYVLILAPVLIAGFYLVLHPEYIVRALNNPYLVACILAIPVCVFLVKLVFNFFSVIEQWIRLQIERIRTAKRGQFLEFVIAVFMFVSVCEAGPFFNKVQGNILGGALGYITVFAFDLVAVVCMRSRAKMLRKGHDKQAHIYQMGVWICALVSIYANADSAIVNLSLASLDKNPLAFLSPLAGVAFPVMIIFLSNATDTDEDIDDPALFKMEQQKRVEFAKAKREIATALYEEKVQFSLLHQREFFLKSWLFSKAKIDLVVEIVVGKVMKNVSSQVHDLRQEMERKEQVIAEHTTLVQQLSTEMKGQAQLITRQIEEIDTLKQQVYDAIQGQYADFQQHMNQSLTRYEMSLQSQLAAAVTSYADEQEDVQNVSLEGNFLAYEFSPDEEISKPRITVNLDERLSSPGRKHDRTTDELLTVQKTGNKKETSSSLSGEAAKRIRRIVKRNPNVKVSDLANRIGVSPGYASKIKSQVLAEMKEPV